MSSIYDVVVRDQQQNDTTLAEYEGKVLLIVNTAIECGLAVQYEELQTLYERYQNQDFVILDFPSNEFEQSPEDNDETDAFCTLNYSTTFPRFDKVKVNGTDADSLYKYLKRTNNGEMGEDIAWNFTKFLVNRHGKLVNRFEPGTTPKEFEEEIKAVI